MEEYGGGLGRVRSALEDHLQGGGGVGKEVNVGHVGVGRKPSQEERRGMCKRKHLSIEGGTLSGKGNGDTTDPTSSIEDNQGVAGTSLWVVGTVSIDNQRGRRGRQRRYENIMFGNKRTSIVRATPPYSQ